MNNSTSKTTTLINSGKFNRFKTTAREVFDITGHRGCRGLMPENTIHAFIEALKLGANTLEMDVVVTGDRQLILSHEPWMSPEICLAPDGLPLAKSDLRNIYKMTYDEIQQYDCGQRINPLFPMQKSISAVKPLLSEVINRVEKYILWNSFRPVFYNIEIKTAPEWDHIFQPKPEDVVLKVYDMIRQHNIQRRCTIQSFDIRALQLFKRIASQQRLSLLLDNDFSMEENLDALGFIPDIYSPEYKLISAAMIKEAHQKGMSIIPWTVNDILDMNELKQMGVDGLITDYPDIALKLVE